ncbi:MAG: twin-arginine translocation signal domain-containing protein [Bacteroidetes bacterium]|nr:MAG: twin-arginine translocation signal domain-containing protein [Bacteroidota bacterium]
MKSNNGENNPRRDFLGKIAGGAAALGLSTIINPVSGFADNSFNMDTGNPDEWFKQLKGKHRIVFDVPEPNGIFPFAWPRIFLVTNAATGTNEKDCNVVVVLRHTAIGYAMEDRLWPKYNFGEVFKAEDPKTQKPSTRNPFWKPKQGDYNIPGVGMVPIGINELQESGVLFCVCDMALTVYSGVVAKSLNMDAAEVKKDWMSGLLPGIKVMPAGIWAINRAQEHGCSYCFAG